MHCLPAQAPPCCPPPTQPLALPASPPCQVPNSGFILPYARGTGISAHYDEEHSWGEVRTTFTGIEIDMNASQGDRKCCGMPSICSTLGQHDAPAANRGALPLPPDHPGHLPWRRLHPGHDPRCPTLPRPPAAPRAHPAAAPLAVRAERAGQVRVVWVWVLGCPLLGCPTGLQESCAVLCGFVQVRDHPMCFWLSAQPMLCCLALQLI